MAYTSNGIIWRVYKVCYCNPQELASLVFAIILLQCTVLHLEA